MSTPPTSIAPHLTDSGSKSHARKLPSPPGQVAEGSVHTTSLQGQPILPPIERRNSHSSVPTYNTARQGDDNKLSSSYPAACTAFHGKGMGDDKVPTAVDLPASPFIQEQVVSTQPGSSSLAGATSAPDDINQLCENMQTSWNLEDAPQKRMTDTEYADAEVCPEIKLVFKADLGENSCVDNVKNFSLTFSERKWRLLASSGRLRRYKQFQDGVTVQTVLNKKLVTVSHSSKLREEELVGWVIECVKIINSCLLEIETANIFGHGVARVAQMIKEESSGNLVSCHMSEGKDYLEVYAIDSLKMDEICTLMEPVLSNLSSVRLLLKVPVQHRDFEMLRYLGFRDHFLGLIPGNQLQMYLDFRESSIVLESLVDKRRMLRGEIRNFLEKHAYVSLSVENVTKCLLFDARAHLLKKLLDNGLRGWWLEMDGQVKVLASSPDVAHTVSKFLKAYLMSYTYPFNPLLNQILNHLKKIAPHGIFTSAPTKDGQSIQIVVVGDARQWLLEQISSHGTSSGRFAVSHPSEIREEKQMQGTGNEPGQREGMQMSGTSSQPGQREGVQPSGTGCQPGQKDEMQPSDTGYQPGQREGRQPSDNGYQPGQREGRQPSGTGCQPGQREGRQPSDTGYQPGQREGRQPSGTGYQPGHGEGRQPSDTGYQPGQREGRQPSGTSYQPGHGEGRQPSDTGYQPGHGEGRQPSGTGYQPGHGEGRQPSGTGCQPGHGEVNDKERDSVPSAPLGVVLRQDACQPGSIQVDDLVNELLQFGKNLLKLKGEVHDRQCFVKLTPEGFIEITGGSRSEGMAAIEKLFYMKRFESDIDDSEFEQALKTFKVDHSESLTYCKRSGVWFICFTSDAAKLVFELLEVWKQLKWSVPLPLYAHDFAALKLGNIRQQLKVQVHQSVKIGLSTEVEPKVVLSADRGNMSKAVEWLQNLVLSIETAEKKIEVHQAVGLQGVKNQKFIQRMETEYVCRVDIQQKGKPIMSWTSPQGLMILVCENSMATTDCDIMVLPLGDEQSDWPPLHKYLLRKSFLSTDIQTYHEAVKEIPLLLQCHGHFAGQRIAIVPVPDKWEAGQKQEKARIMKAYQQVFSACKGDQQSLAVLARQSPQTDLVKPLKAILQTIFEMEPGSGSRTVVIYTDSPQQTQEVCGIVNKGLRQGWTNRPLRVPRPALRKRMIQTEIGEIQKTVADVVVNSTGKDLKVDQGAVEKAILKAAGKELIQECEKIYPDGIPPCGLAITNTFRMKNAKKIYHVALSRDKFPADDQKESAVLLHDLSTVVYRCLLQASWENYTSIAFPTLGSGKLAYPCGVVAQTMFSTINNFFREMPHSSLEKVIIVIFSENREAIQAFKKEEILHLYTYATDKRELEDRQGLSMHLGKHIIQGVHGNVDQKPCVAEVCIRGELASEKSPNTGQNSRTYDDQGCKTIVLKTFTKTEYKDSLQKALEHRGVSVQILAHTLRFQYFSMEELVKQLEVLLEHKKDLKLVSVIFSDEEKVGRFASSFKAVDGGCVQISENESKHGDVFVCAPKLGTIMERIQSLPLFPRLTHIAFLQELKETESSGIQLPDTWTPHDSDEPVMLAKLKPSDVEYQRVKQDIMATIGKSSINIVSVDRIQNVMLYQQYQAKKTHMDKQNGPGFPNERTLWHGTSPDAILSINNHGFNRSYCRENATVYGKGVYFATKSSYSTYCRYSPPDSSGRCFVYQCQVLVGHPTLGSSDMRVLPPRSDHVFYDSATNNLHSPDMYVIFNDTQAYPQYLITFTLV